MSPLEITASLVALLGVYLTSRKLSTGWVVGALGSVLYAVLFFLGKLYAESILQLIYAAVGLRGWILWQKESQPEAQGIKRINRKQFILGLLMMGLLSLVCGWALEHYSDSDVPWLDAFLASAGLTVTVWMMQRCLENWLFWIGIDMASAVLYFSRDMPIAALVYLIFTALAVYGYWQWKNDLARD
jgi:nicotinamide mononucleotide transporter